MKAKSLARHGKYLKKLKEEDFTQKTSTSKPLMKPEPKSVILVRVKTPIIKAINPSIYLVYLVKKKIWS